MTASGLVVVPATAVSAALEGNETNLVGIVENAYRLHRDRKAAAPPQSSLHFPERSARVVAMPAHIAAENETIGLKWIASFPQNLRRGLPRASAVIMLNDAVTGRPKACLEGALISAARTAASAALAAMRLLPEPARRGRIALVGAGVISLTVYRYLRACDIGDGSASIFDADRGRAERLARFLSDRGEDVAAAKTLEQAVAKSGVVVFATNTLEPHVHSEKLFEHRPLVLHLSLRDLSPSLLFSTTNVVDDRQQALTAGTSLGIAAVSSCRGEAIVDATLGDVLAGDYNAPAELPVVFAPFGLGILDLAVAEFVLRRAEIAGSLIDVPDFFDGGENHDSVR